jgi:curved DNA-binding protein CbpA
MLAKTASTPARSGGNSSAVNGPYLGGRSNSQPALPSRSNAFFPTASSVRVRAVSSTFHDMEVECNDVGQRSKRGLQAVQAASAASGQVLAGVISPATLPPLNACQSNHYQTLGLDPGCTTSQVRAAFRVLARKYHPDLNRGSAEAVGHCQRINAAYEVLSNPGRRRDYDRSLSSGRRPKGCTSRKVADVCQEVHLRIEELIQGTSLEVRVNDPGNPPGAEAYPLVIPPGTAPGTRFRVARSVAATGGLVLVRVRALAGFRFKVRGSDLRCDLRVPSRRVAQGGEEMLIGPTGERLRLQIPPHIARGEILRIAGQGLPTARGGRGDLLVRILYRPEVRIVRQACR